MQKVEFRNESFRWKVTIKNAQGEITPVDKVTSMEVLLYGEFEKDIWHRCKYPEEPGFIPVKKADDDFAFFIELSPEQTMNAPLGTMIIQITYRMEDDRFDTGYVQRVEKGKLLSIKKTRL